jgi:hypothetical protein
MNRNRLISLIILIGCIVVAIVIMSVFGNKTDGGAPIAPGMYHGDTSGDDDSSSDSDSGGDSGGDDVSVDVGK